MADCAGFLEIEVFERFLCAAQQIFGLVSLSFEPCPRIRVVLQDFVARFMGDVLLHPDKCFVGTFQFLKTGHK